jgi:hypothetical protein
MNADDLTPKQVQRLNDAIRRQLGYLTRLVQRMERRGWEPSDRVFRAALDAQRAMYTLSVHLHYAAVRDWVHWPVSPSKSHRQ